MRHEPDTTPRARIPSDVDTPDKIVWGLTARQLAILTVAALFAYSLYKTVGHALAPPVLVAVMVPLAGVAVVVAVGRRDGLSLDAWLLAAIGHRRRPRRLVPAATATIAAAPSWAPATTAATATTATTAAAAGAPPVSVLRLPAQAISESGAIDTGTCSAALIACTTVSIGLRTGDEQAALIGGFGRWLNSLSAPVQIVVSATRVDLASHAQRIAEHAATQANPALADAAHDYARFLDDLAARRDPLWRTVTVAVTADGPARGHDLARRADHSAKALATLGVHTSILDGATVTSVLSAAVDPYTPADAGWSRARPGTTITGAKP